MKVIKRSPLVNLIIDIVTIFYIAAMSTIPAAIIYLILYVFQKSLPLECDLKLFIEILVCLTILKAAIPVKKDIHID